MCRLLPFCWTIYRSAYKIQKHTNTDTEAHIWVLYIVKAVSAHCTHDQQTSSMAQENYNNYNAKTNQQTISSISILHVNLFIATHYREYDFLRRQNVHWQWLLAIWLLVCVEAGALVKTPRNVNDQMQQATTNKKNNQEQRIVWTLYIEFFALVLHRFFMIYSVF